MRSLIIEHTSYSLYYGLLFLPTADRIDVVPRQVHRQICCTVQHAARKPRGHHAKCHLPSVGLLLRTNVNHRHDGLDTEAARRRHHQPCYENQHLKTSVVVMY